MCERKRIIRCIYTLIRNGYYCIICNAIHGVSIHIRITKYNAKLARGALQNVARRSSEEKRDERAREKERERDKKESQRQKWIDIYIYIYKERQRKREGTAGLFPFPFTFRTRRTKSFRFCLAVSRFPGSVRVSPGKYRGRATYRDTERIDSRRLFLLCSCFFFFFFFSKRIFLSSNSHPDLR